MALPVLPTYIPIEEAAQRFGLEVAQLRLLAESGKIEAAQLPDGDVMVREDELKDTGELPRFIPLVEAVERYGLNGERLTRLIEKGDITAVTVPDGDILVDANQVKALAERSKVNLPEYQQYAHLKGQPIWIGKASREYGIPQPTISRWVRKGYIRKIGKDKNRVLIDAQDMAYCAEIYKKAGGGAGRWVFNPDGTPYTPREMRDIEKETA